MRIIILLFTTITLTTFANAQPTKSVYTSVDIKQCQLVDKAKPGDGEWARWRCAGYHGIDVYVTEADIRFSISFQNNNSGFQTLPPFNTIGKNLEWRLRQEQDGTWQPFATILRYFTDSNGKKGQILVVGKFENRNSCHIAYIDALANKNANQLAQFIADKLTNNFDCTKDQAIIVGKSGVSPM